MNPATDAEHLLRELAPQVLSALLRRTTDFSAAEDAVQEAMLAASQQWPRDGMPDDPRGWLVTVAGRRLIDEIRGDAARRRREEREVALGLPLAADHADTAGDDTLSLLFLCCHPSLSAPSQLALTLRAVGGLTTAQIASAFLVPEASMAQRISRAKQAIRAAGARFEPPPIEERSARLVVVTQVLYLIFNEGYAASSGAEAQRAELAGEAIRLVRLLLRLVQDARWAPRDHTGEVAGLLALLLLTDARRPARTTPDGLLVPLAEQDRSLWNADQIAEGLALVARTLGTGAVGPYQLQAAIAALHDEASTADATDWPQILALYTVLERVIPSPVVRLNRAVALAEVHGPLAGLAVLGTLDDDHRMAATHRVDAVRAHLLELAGEPDAARAAYQRAARRAGSIPEQRYLAFRASRLAPPAS